MAHAIRDVEGDAEGNGSRVDGGAGRPGEAVGGHEGGELDAARGVRVQRSLGGGMTLTFALLPFPHCLTIVCTQHRRYATRPSTLPPQLSCLLSYRHCARANRVTR